MFKGLDSWLPSYLGRTRFREPSGTIDIMIAVCDHFEPLHRADKNTALERIARWKKEFPKLIEPFRDFDQCRPRHTFFYPIEQYDEHIVSQLAELCRLCGGEVEIHLHHENDTADGLRVKLECGKADFLRHGLLSRDEAGNVRYGFIHGNWALDNSHPQGRGCGVNNELEVLKATGCFADFTLPSAPSPTQTRIINSIYYASGTPGRKSHNSGKLAEVGKRAIRSNNLLLVQGPLGLNWERRKFGIFPRIENGEITGVNPPRRDRMRLWLKLGIHVQAQPNWLFIKLHTHGGIPPNMNALLGEPARRFYEHLAMKYNDGKTFRLHFVTARELVNIIHAAEDGHSGNAGVHRNYRYKRELAAPVLNCEGDASSSRI